MKSLFLLLLLVLFQFKGFTQFVSNEIDNIVSEYTKNPQNKLTFFYTIEKYQDDTIQLNKIMVELVKHLHKDEEIDFQIVNSLLDVANGRFSNSFVIKDEALLKLTDILNDLLVLSSNRNFIAENLMYYNFGLYNEQSKNSLLKSLKNRKLCFNWTILEVGALNIPGGKQALQTIIDSNWTEFKDAALVALCRMGDKHSLDIFFTKINKIDPVEKAFDQYYRKIEYIKQPESILFLVKLLDSKALNEMPKETMKPTKFAATIVRVLSRMIIDFPIKYFNDAEEDNAIKMAKEWWKENKSTYKINREKY
ncbi:hypothetical protein [Pinibacter aurantiacus]|uniref:HEAT repeat domain-containing protein n=1 Tax=Pinibacter aurantiacus TaxID=2851599 RepID=A0A9E2W7T0_9BACT|nr:hypothetical protein [Pinibacter aurantiacus]MBV4357196.1 hypothetical protein [Pinibacter aurantiacus]